MISTPSRPNPTAIHWLGLIRSPSSAEATVTSTGVRKITAVASASGMKCRPLMNSRLTLTRLNPRSSCGQGRKVRNTRCPMRGTNSAVISTVCAT